MHCNACHNEFLSGTCLTCGVHSLMNAERESCRREGRREMLWLMAVGLETRSWFMYERMERTCLGTMLGLRNSVLRTLAETGDEQARRILEEV